MKPHRRKLGLSLLGKLVLAFVGPTVLLFSLFGFVAHEVQRSDLEAELGRRLETVASAAATQLRGKYLTNLQAGDEVGNLSYSGARKRLLQVQEATGVKRLYVFDSEFRTKVDTEGAPIDSKQFQAEIDRREISELFSKAISGSSLLFEGVDGARYKAGYAPLYESDEVRNVVLAIGADAPADYFDRLANLRHQLAVLGLILVLAVGIVAALVARRITRPVRSLAVAAERIAGGDLGAPIAPMSRDEIGFLAATMERMRGELKARDDRMQQMLAGIAHEVRNPLGGMELFSGILREELVDDEEKRSHVVRIETQIQQLKSVVDSFLEYARRKPPSLSPTDLAALVKEVTVLEEGSEKDTRPQIELHLCPVTVLADPVQLRRVFHNLIRNAVEASTEASRPVVVTLDVAPGNWARVQVFNHGEVIDDELKERLFEPFFTTKEKGTGLGLAFVREIVLAHGGKIEVSSSNEDGTCFTVLLSSQKTQ